ncbi:MAG: hypothetical protein NT010_06090 [Proteobacteria bacterium]|nr:hypothetical protein [Pseudomonadota bacterium]
MSLKDWLNKGWVVAHKTSPDEINDLFGVADRDLEDCKTEGLSSHWKLAIAYNAALQMATAALAASGYRSAREAHHYRVIQSLRYTIKADNSLIAQFDKFRKKRNIGGYERALAVSDQEASEMLVLAKRLHEDIEDWLKENYPELFKE